MVSKQPQKKNQKKSKIITLIKVIIFTLMPTKLMYGQTFSHSNTKYLLSQNEVKPEKVNSTSKALKNQQNSNLRKTEVLNKKTKLDNNIKTQHVLDQKKSELNKSKTPIKNPAELTKEFTFGLSGIFVTYLTGGTGGGIDGWAKFDDYSAGVQILISESDIRKADDENNETELFNSKNTFIGIRGHKTLFSNFYISTSLSFIAFKGEYGFSSESDVKVDYSGNGLWTTIGIGHYWNWGPYSLSCDWGGLGYLASSSIELKKERDIELRTSKYFNESPEDRIQFYLGSLTKIYLLQVAFGYRI